MYTYKDANDCHVHKGIHRYRGAHESTYTPIREAHWPQETRERTRAVDSHKSAGPFAKEKYEIFVTKYVGLEVGLGSSSPLSP